MKRSLAAAIVLLFLTASCQPIPAVPPDEIAGAPVEKATESGPMQADLNDFAEAMSIFDEGEKDSEVYKAAILEFVDCLNLNEVSREARAELTPGQDAAAIWLGLGFFMMLGQLDFSDPSSIDNDEKGPETYNYLLSAVELCRQERE